MGLTNNIEFNLGAQKIEADENGVLKITDTTGTYAISSDSEAAALIAVEVTNRNAAINTATGNTMVNVATTYDTKTSVNAKVAEGTGNTLANVALTAATIASLSAYETKTGTDAKVAEGTGNTITSIFSGIGSGTDWIPAASNGGVLRSYTGLTIDATVGCLLLGALDDSSKKYQVFISAGTIVLSATT